MTGLSRIERSEMFTSDISRRLLPVGSSCVTSVRPVAKLSAGRKKLFKVLEKGKLMLEFTRVASSGNQIVRFSKL